MIEPRAIPLISASDPPNTSEKRQSTIVRFLPSLTDGAFLLPLFFLFTRMNGASRLLEGDTGWHIRTGEWILANGKVPRVDMFSYTKPGEPWFAWEWLWDVMFAWLHQRWGMEAVVLASIFVICLTFALLFRLVRNKCGNPFIAMAFTTLAIAGSSIHWWARPHVFTMLFVVVCLWILERENERNSRLLWLLPPMMLLWTNLHGGFVAGLILIAGYCAGEVVSVVLAVDRSERTIAAARAKRYLLIGAACGAVTLMNPYGIALHAHIIRTLREPMLYRHITEFMSISFSIPTAIYFEIAILLGTATAFWRLRQRRFAHVILLAGWLHMALLSARNIPLYLIIAAPLAAEATAEWLERVKAGQIPHWLARVVGGFQRAGAEFHAIDRIGRAHIASALAFVFIAVLVSHSPSQGRFFASYTPESYPVKAIEYLRAREAGRIFTNDEWGDYVIYRMYPNARVFVDGRSDFYGPELMNTYMNTIGIHHGWKTTIRRYGINTVLLPVREPLSGALKESRDWKPVYDDGVAIIFEAVEQAAVPQLVAQDIPVNGNGGRRDRAVAKP